MKSIVVAMATRREISVSKKNNFGHFLSQMLFTFRLLIAWRDDSCCQTNVGKELLRNFLFGALGPRTNSEEIRRCILLFLCTLDASK